MNAVPPVVRPFTWRLGRQWRLTRKELNEILRDRRTLLTLFLMPLLLYPLLGMAFVEFFRSNMAGLSSPAYRIGCDSEYEGHLVQMVLERGERALEARGFFAHPENTRGAPVAEPSPHLQAKPDLRLFVDADLEEQVKANGLDLGIRFRGPPPAPFNPSRQVALDVELLYRADSSVGRDAARYVQGLFVAAEADFLAQRLSAFGVTQRGSPVEVRVTTVYSERSRKESILGTLIPLILILMTITGAVYPAIDLTAGERERGTLEVLVAAPVPRLSVLFAKYVAVLTVALLTAVFNLGPMVLTLVLSGLYRDLFSFEGWIHVWIVLSQVFGLLILFAAFFSAVLLIFTSFARSFKEAQAYLIPLMLLALTPGVLSLLPNLKLEGELLFIPLMNIVLLARDLLQGTAPVPTTLKVVLITAVYAGLAIALASQVFGTEAVLSSQPGKWTSRLRRLFSFGRRRTQGNAAPVP
jgi:sodium transport system permease protein